MKKGLEALTNDELNSLEHAVHLAEYENENYHLRCYLLELKNEVIREIDRRESNENV